MQQPEVKAFFDEATYTVSYVVTDPATKKCAVVDSVLDYDPNSGRTAKTSADAVIVCISATTISRWTGSWRPTFMPTTCPRPPT